MSVKSCGHKSATSIVKMFHCDCCSSSLMSMLTQPMSLSVIDIEDQCPHKYLTNFQPSLNVWFYKHSLIIYSQLLLPLQSNSAFYQLLDIYQKFNCAIICIFCLLLLLTTIYRVASLHNNEVNFSESHAYQSVLRSYFLLNFEQIIFTFAQNLC